MNTIKFLKSNGFNGITDAAAIREKFRSFGINVSFENNGAEAKRQRFIFTSSKQSRFKTQNDMVYEANGLILEAVRLDADIEAGVITTWNKLVIPPRAPLSNINTKVVNKFIDENKYDIYYIEDGTVVSLYFYKPENKWVFSTLKGIDVNSIVFNNFSYKDMFDSVLEANHINVMNFYNGLNKDFSYTFGFKHPDLHPFMETRREQIHKIWFIQYSDIPNNIVVRHSPWAHIHGHKKIVFTIKSIGSLFNKINKAYDSYLEKGIPLYGFLLTAKDPSAEAINNTFGNDQSHASILLESTLMKYIRNLWYDASYTLFSKGREYNRNKTILINSFLDNNRIDIFNKLFPQYAETMNNLVTSEINMVDNIYEKIKNNNQSNSQDDPQNIVSSDLDNDDILDSLCKQVTDKLTVDNHVRPKQKIREIIHNTANIDHYYKLLT